MKFTMLDKFLKYIIVLIIFLKSVISVPQDIKEINSIDDLRKTDFGQTYPRHGLFLLHWFANNINIDNNNVITLQHFEPYRGDYGFHHYGNFELLLDPLPCNSTYRYYTLGNLNTTSNLNARALPTYVTSTYQNAAQDRNRNIDRIVIRIRQADNSESTLIVDQVYITQHYESPSTDSAYDPANTYSVTPNLLREIRNLPQQNIQALQQRYGYINQNTLNNNNVNLNYNIKLLLLIVTAGHWIITTPHNRYPRQVLISGDNVLPMKLEVETLAQGKAKLSWSDIPSRFLKDNVMVALYKDDYANSYKTYKSVEYKPSGSYETWSYLNPGFQVRLHMPQDGWFSTYPGTELWRGPELHDANRVLPTYIRGYRASLQLFVRDGTACVRLYLKKSFTDWETEFYYSWVGIYSSDKSCMPDYVSYNWVTRFNKESRTDLENIPDYNVYFICFGNYIAPGIQARFILTKEYLDLVRTPQWKGVFSEDL